VVNHEHAWYFTFAPGHWTATCGGGLEVTVEEPEPGQEVWRWRLHGGVPPVAMLLDAVTSVVRARRERLGRFRPGWPE
jgi:hypothetical protein